MAYISTPEVAAIRKALKAEFGKRFKFSVTKRDGGLAVAVAIMSGSDDFSYLWSKKSPDDYGYGYTSINPYYTERYPEHADVFDKIIKIIKTAPATAPGGKEWFDKSDIMTDYFHTAFYFDVNIGKWDRPYQRADQ